MNIKTVQVHNIAGIKDAKLDVQGHHLFLIGGENAAGKSSAINALVMALCGKRGCDYHPAPLRNGEEEGWVRIEADNGLDQQALTIERRIERRPDGSLRETLKITNGDGFESPEPQTLLNTLYKLRGFDPLEFLRKKPKDQIDILKSLMGVDLDSIDADIQSLEEKRKNANAEVKRLKGAFDSAPFFDGVPSQPVSISSLTEAYDKANQHNAKIDELKKVAFDAKCAMDSIANEKKRYTDKIVEYDNDIVSLKEQIEAINEKIENIKGRIQKGMQLVAETDGKLSDAKAAYEDAVNAVSSFELVPTGEITAKMKTVEETNQKVEYNRRRAEIKSELHVAEEVAKELDDSLSKRREERTQAISSADWPDGMSFDDKNGISINGVPLTGCSTAEKTILSAQIGMKMNPGLKMMVIERGESLTSSSLEDLEAIAKDKGYLILVEYVCHNDADRERCHVILEDGVVVNGAED